MDYIFEIEDYSCRKVHLTKERWKHITAEHPEITDYEIIKEVIVKPTKIISSDRDERVQWYFLYNKERSSYLKVSVRYLNGEGFIITSHYTKKIQ